MSLSVPGNPHPLVGVGKAQEAAGSAPSQDPMHTGLITHVSAASREIQPRPPCRGSAPVVGREEVVSIGRQGYRRGREESKGTAWVSESIVSRAALVTCEAVLRSGPVAC